MKEFFEKQGYPLLFGLYFLKIRVGIGIPPSLIEPFAPWLGLIVKKKLYVNFGPVWIGICTVVAKSIVSYFRKKEETSKK